DERQDPQRKGKGGKPSRPAGQDCQAGAHSDNQHAGHHRALSSLPVNTSTEPGVVRSTVRTVSPSRRFKGRPSLDRTLTRSSVPSFHDRSISKPLRARTPVIRPDGHAVGNAGSSRISPASFWTS